MSPPFADETTVKLRNTVRARRASLENGGSQFKTSLGPRDSLSTAATGNGRNQTSLTYSPSSIYVRLWTTADADALIFARLSADSLRGFSVHPPRGSSDVYADFPMFPCNCTYAMERIRTPDADECGGWPVAGGLSRWAEQGLCTRIPPDERTIREGTERPIHSFASIYSSSGLVAYIFFNTTAARGRKCTMSCTMRDEGTIFYEVFSYLRTNLVYVFVF